MCYECGVSNLAGSITCGNCGHQINKRKNTNPGNKSQSRGEAWRPYGPSGPGVPWRNGNLAGTVVRSDTTPDELQPWQAGAGPTSRPWMRGGMATVMQSPQSYAQAVQQQPGDYGQAFWQWQEEAPQVQQRHPWTRGGQQDENHHLWHGEPAFVQYSPAPPPLPVPQVARAAGGMGDLT